MNKRALIYLGLASATLAAAYVYVIHIETTPVSSAIIQHDNAQALQSVSVVHGSVTTGLLKLKAHQGAQVQFLVYSDESDSVIVEGLDARVAAPGKQSTLVTLQAKAPGLHTIELDIKGIALGQIEVLPN